MPIVLRVKGYRFGFYASDGMEPPHVHVSSGTKNVKFWLVPVVTLEKNQGFRPFELNEIKRLTDRHRDELLEAWDEFFGDQN